MTEKDPSIEVEKPEFRPPLYLWLPMPMLAGMLICHMVAAIWIWNSNQELHTVVQMLGAQNYVTVPNAISHPLLLSFKTAFLSATFFSFTLGVGLSLLFMFIGMMSALMPSFRIGVFFFGGAQVLLLLFLNAYGFTLYPTALFVLIPLVSGGLMWRRIAVLNMHADPGGMAKVFFVIPVIICGIMWTLQSSKTPFIDIRDTLLLSNSPGIAVNDFYYQYTLYAARTFKPMDKRPMRTVRLEGNPHAPRNTMLKKHLLDIHYLPVDGPGPVDVSITFDGKGNMTLTGWHGERISTSITKFRADPKKFMEDISDESDCLKNFRILVFESLMYGLPMGIYLFFFSLMAGLASLALGRTRGAAIAAGIWLVIGVVLYVQLAFWTGHSHEGKALQDMLASESYRTRLAALRFAVATDQDIRGYSGYDKALHSPRMIERYWVARALVSNHSPGGYRDLVQMLDDPSPNVQCQALWALSNLRKPRTTRRILEVIETSDHMYVQQYAYNALRRLGWRQAS